MLEIYRRKMDAHPVAAMSPGIKILTLLILLMTLGFFIAALRDPRMWVGAWIAAGIVLVCYFTSPVSFCIWQGRLVVMLGLFGINYGRILSCGEFDEDKLPFTLRLFGNGGVFAGTGIFWNKRWGVFRIYTTSTDVRKMVLVDTDKHRVLISPADPKKFIRAAEGGKEVGK